MECPKCHTQVDDNQTMCPKCHKVLQLECPNCHTLGESAVCQTCGYSILVKCSKCSKIIPVEKEYCTKCGFPTSTSVAYQECESDEFASIIIKFGALKNIRKLLKSKELYSKFYFKLKNLLFAQVKGLDCKFISYDDEFVINFNKELSLATSSNKATRFALKLANAFVGLNSNIMEELSTPLNLTLTIIKKSAEQLLELTTYENNVKPLNIKKDRKKYLKGIQIVLDQYVCDEINKEYKVDSLYSVEENGKTVMFYEILLDSYVLPPTSEKDEVNIQAIQKNIVKNENIKAEKDIYSFNVFDINAKCSFEKVTAISFWEKLNSIDLNKSGKLIALRSTLDNAFPIQDIVQFYEKNEYKVLRVSCTEELSYKPWGVFEVLFREYCGLTYHNKFLDLSKINQNFQAQFKPLFDLILNKPVKAMSPEDARFTYMELWNKFLMLLSKTVIIIEGFENVDDTTIQTLELYFDKFKAVKPNFLFVTNDDVSVHSKIKGLLRTNLYTEFTLRKTSMEDCLATIKSDATDFIQSFYFEKIKENFKGSYLYFENALKYLKETGVLIDFDNKLIIKNKKSVIIPKDVAGIYKSRMKNLSRNMDVSLIFAYASVLGSRLDLTILRELGIKDIEKNVKILVETGFASLSDDILFMNDFNRLLSIITSSLKRDAETFLSKTIVAQIGKGLDDTTLALIMGRMKLYKEEYLTLWKSSQFALKVGDFDAYLKLCLGFLSLVEHIESNISKEEVEDNKKEVYNNILMCLYAYSPAKIYFIENVLLMDAINQGDDEKIVKLSNLMLQGALISSNYSDALGLLHNILSRMSNPTLIVDGAINTKFLLLSLVNIEILYNIGDYKQCVEIAQEILSIINPEVLEKVKPASFSTNLFVSHILDTFRLIGFAKLFLLDDNIEEFFEEIHSKLNIEFPEKDAILAIRDYLAGKVYNLNNIENYSSYSKVIFLILQEFSVLKDDYKRFAQNIYQAKLLASEIHNAELEFLCDLLIAYAYDKNNVVEKARFIYKDVINKSEKSAMFNIILLAKYFLAKQSVSLLPEESLLLVNDSLAMIRKYDNQAKILYALFEKLYIDIVVEKEIPAIDLEIEEQKLQELKSKLSLLIGEVNIEA